MRIHALVVIVAVALGFTATACRGSGEREHDPVPAPTPAPERTGVADAEARATARQMDLLVTLIEGDRAAVQTEEGRVAQVREAVRVGRGTQGELLAAELELLRSRQTLHLREWELQAARRGMPSEPLGTDVLGKLVAGDRAAVAIEEQRVANVKSLFEAGRAARTEVQNAELELLRRLQTLQSRERDLQDARQRETAAPRPAATDGTPSTPR